jgi:diguanylate cyclase (GGDEF)-like protein
MASRPDPSPEAAHDATVTDIGPSRSSWICRDDTERQRFLDMHHRILPAHRRVLLVIGALIAPTLPWDNVLVLIPIMGALITYSVLQVMAVRFPRPELIIAAGLAVSQALLTTAIVINGSQHTAGLAILIWPLVAAGGRFPTRVVRVATAYTAVLMLIASLGFDGSSVLHDPVLLTLPLAAMLSITMMSTVVRESDINHRSAAILDQLTGMLNRTALATRTTEIEHQSAATGEPVGLIVADVDHFKEINDLHGHTRGDVVLRDLAYLLRKQLRAFDLAYRLGGEEFAILVLGADQEATALVAQRLCDAVAVQPVGGLAITMSFGVAASVAGEGFVWDVAYEHADAALYRAKKAGRNQVCIGPDVSVAAEQLVPAA